MPVHLNNQCSTFSTSLLLQFLHTLPSLLTPRHLPVSTSNAAVPPLNCTRTLLLHLHFTSTHRASYPFSINFCTSANFEWLLASSFQLSIASLHATSLSICLTSLIDKLFSPSARNPSLPLYIWPQTIATDGLCILRRWSFGRQNLWQQTWNATMEHRHTIIIYILCRNSASHTVML